MCMQLASKQWRQFIIQQLFWGRIALICMLFTFSEMACAILSFANQQLIEAVWKMHTDWIQMLLEKFSKPIIKSFKKVQLFCLVVSGAWGYAPRYRELADKIKADVPAANVVGHVGRRCKFVIVSLAKHPYLKISTPRVIKGLVI